MEKEEKEEVGMKKVVVSAFALSGLALLIYGVISAVIYSNVIWYSYFVIGMTLFIGGINYFLKNNSVLRLGWGNIVKTYVFYMFFTILIEIIGRFVLNFWHYPHFGLVDKMVHVFLIGYPFAFFSIHESYKLINKMAASTQLTILIATLLNAFIHEIPNIFAWEWIYTIPLITFEILQINIVVIVGWVVLVAVPLIVGRVISSN